MFTLWIAPIFTARQKMLHPNYSKVYTRQNGEWEYAFFQAPKGELLIYNKYYPIK